MLTIARAIETCAGRPAQWDAWTDTGQYLYLRYRWGRGTVDAYDDQDPDTWGRVPDGRVAEFQDEDEWAGEITLERFCARAGLHLALLEAS